MSELNRIESSKEFWKSFFKILILLLICFPKKIYYCFVASTVYSMIMITELWQYDTSVIRNGT